MVLLRPRHEAGSQLLSGVLQSPFPDPYTVVGGRFRSSHPVRAGRAALLTLCMQAWGLYVAFGATQEVFYANQDIMNNDSDHHNSNWCMKRQSPVQDMYHDTSHL